MISSQICRPLHAVRKYKLHAFTLPSIHCKGCLYVAYVPTSIQSHLAIPDCINLKNPVRFRLVSGITKNFNYTSLID